MAATTTPLTIVVIPDTQARPGAPTDHLDWIGRYILDTFVKEPTPPILVHLGDHWDMPSLSSYDKKGSKSMEGRRVKADIDAGNEAWEVLTGPMDQHNARMYRNHKDRFRPKRYRLIGNHEDRITRAIEADPQLEGLLSLDMLESPKWTVIPYQEVLELGGVRFSHYFVNNSNGRPLAGMVETRIKTLGASFVQGHQQGLKVGTVDHINGRHRGVVAGSCYLTAEAYRGPQATGEWRGILVMSNVHDGDFDLSEVSLGSLCLRYEGVTLTEYMHKHHGAKWAA